MYLNLRNFFRCFIWQLSYRDDCSCFAMRQTPRRVQKHASLCGQGQKHIKQSKLVQWWVSYKNENGPLAFEHRIRSNSTLDLSEFNVNVMTENNEAYQRSPYDPVIWKWPFFFVQTPEFFLTSMKLSFASYIMRSIKVKNISGVWTSKKGHFWIPGS